MGPTVHFTLRVPVELMAELQAQADRERRSVAQVIVMRLMAAGKKGGRK